MLIAVVIVSVSLVVMFTLVHRALFPFLQAEKIKQRLKKEGVMAEAVLLEMEQTGLYVNKLPQVRLQMRVKHESGGNFISETREALTLADLAQLPVGSTVKVRYNPRNRKEIMLVR